MVNTEDRREYERINVDTEAQFFIRTETEFICEFIGIVDNVSESGMCVQIDKSTHDRVGEFLEIGQTLVFHGYDDKGVSITEKYAIFKGEGKIVRREVTEDAIDIGCQIDAKCAVKDKVVRYANRKKYIYI